MGHQVPLIVIERIESLPKLIFISFEKRLIFPIWNALKPEMLSRKAEKAISAANNSDGIICCDISLWEIAMLMYKGRLSIDVQYLKFIELILESDKYIIRGITPEIAGLSARLFSDNN